MSMNSSKTLFISAMLLGIMMSISSNNWIMMWCGLEISLVSIIPLMISESIMSSESTMKYFIVQSISSSMLMLGLMIMIMKGDYNYEYTMMTALVIKMAVAPFHNWMLTVLEGLNQLMMIIMLTINKVAPMTILSYLKNELALITLMTVMVGATMGLNQNSMKKIMGYSSIFNMGFMLAVIKYTLMWIQFLMIYSMMLSMVIIMMKKNKMNFMNQMVFSESITIKMSFWINLLSMGGMPPLMGFSIKYMVMSQLIQMKMMIMILMMAMMSLLVMFYYLRMTFMSIMNNSIMKKSKAFSLMNTSNWMIMLNLSMLPTLMLTKT